MAAPAFFPATWSKERRLVGEILAADWSVGAKRVWDKALFRDIDWSKIPKLAWQYKIRPMTAAALREAGWPGVPAEIRAALEAAEKRCCEKTMWQLKLLAALAAEAERRGIRLIVMKGVALSIRLYGNPFIREAFDLDLLIDPGEETRFHEILRAQGCRVTASRPRLTPRQTAILRRYHHDRGFLHLPSGMKIESHHKLSSNRHLIGTDFEALWSARETVPLTGSSVTVMGEEDLVHYLIVHAARHGWERWKWVADLIVLGRKADAARLSLWRQRAVREGNADIFDSWLLLSAAVASCPLPRQAFEAAARNRRACALAKRALDMSGGDRSLAEISSLAYMLKMRIYRLRLKRTIRYLVTELAALMHRDQDWYTLRLPDRFIWLYYVLRPLLLVWRRGCVPLAAILGKSAAKPRASGADEA